MTLDAQQIVALLVATSFAAGLNVYATVATLGILGRTDLVTLPPSLHLLQNWWVIAVALAMFVIEFFADKIPAFDLVWNALHTFIRVPVAALLAYGATSQLAPWQQMGATVLGGGLGFAAHGGKTAARAAVTPSPEPFSNIGLSLGEDVVAVFLTWVATQHPYIAVAVVALLVLIIVLTIRLVWRALRRLFRGAERQLEQSAAHGISHG